VKATVADLCWFVLRHEVVLGTSGGNVAFKKAIVKPYAQHRFFAGVRTKAIAIEDERCSKRRKNDKVQRPRFEATFGD
jgi:hypothetical protein